MNWVSLEMWGWGCIVGLNVGLWIYWAVTDRAERAQKRHFKAYVELSNELFNGEYQEKEGVK